MFLSFLFLLTDIVDVGHSYIAGEEQHCRPVGELVDTTALGPEIEKTVKSQRENIDVEI